MGICIYGLVHFPSLFLTSTCFNMLHSPGFLDICSLMLDWFIIIQGCFKCAFLQCYIYFHFFILLITPSVYGDSVAMTILFFMHVCTHLESSSDGFAAEYICFAGTSLVMTVMRSIGTDSGRLGAWCWIEAQPSEQACIHFLMLSNCQVLSNSFFSLGKIVYECRNVFLIGF